MKSHIVVFNIAARVYRSLVIAGASATCQILELRDVRNTDIRNKRQKTSF